MKMMRPLLVSFALAFAAAAAAGAESPVLPSSEAAPVRNVEETFFGTTVADPYRYFENTADPDVARWMKAQSDRSAATLAQIPGRSALLDKLARYDEAAPARVAQPLRLSGRLFIYEKRDAHDDRFKLYLRRGLQGPEKVLIDPETLTRKFGQPHAVNWFSASHDGRHLAYAVSRQGSEAAVLHVIDLRSGRDVGEPITRADLGGVEWAPDGRTLLFNRLQEVPRSAPVTEKYQRSQIYRLRLGQPLARAVPVFGTALRGLGIAPSSAPFVSLSHDGRWAFGIEANGTQREISLYVAPQAGVLSGTPRWRRLFDSGADVTGFSYRDNRLVLLSHAKAPRFKLLALDLRKRRATIADAKPLVAQGDRVITAIASAADALYVEAREGNVKKLYKLPHGAPGSRLTEVPLPVQGSFNLVGDEGGAGAADPRIPGLLIDLQGWNRARQIYVVYPDGRVQNTGLQPRGRFDAPDDVVVTEVKVPSHDGAPVPLSIIHRKDIVLDGRNPTVLHGYASYGDTEEPHFSASRLAWLDAGGVFAIANPRGSGAYGEGWYKAGFQSKKPNSWLDFIACAEYLIREKYTQPARLGIWGGSAGGILVGRAMTERPDLYAAVVSQAGALDMVRAEITPRGVQNIPEFGTRADDSGFRSLLAMSTYHHVQNGIHYPAVLLTHGVNDPRVEVWHSTKAAARLAAASTSGKPVLLRLDYEAGHGIGNTRAQTLAERADVYAFLLWQTGVAGYQPRK